MTANLAHSGNLHPFTGHDLPWLLRTRAALTPDKVFLIFAPFDHPAEEWSYARFYHAVQSVAQGLSERHVKLGDHVLLHMDNCAEFLLVWHACLMLGAVVVTTNTRSSNDELAYFIGHSGAATVITQPRYESSIRASSPPEVSTIIVTEKDNGAPADVPRTEGALRFEDLLCVSAMPPARRPDPTLPGSVQYTSGTTARPKGVVWTQANALWGAQQNARNCDIGPDDVGHTCLPLYHTNALSYSHLATLWAGATLVVQSRFSARRYWPCIVEHGCTWGMQIPFMLKALLTMEAPPPHKITRWGLGAIDPDIIVQTFGIRCIGWFGMTETVAMPLVSSHHFPGRVGAMGLPAPEYGIEIRRGDGEHADFGESGLMWVKGVPGLSLFKAYLNDPEATAAAFDADGWFATGDRVTAFEDGYIRFDGREKDMVRVGGENVAASEIERVIMNAGGILEVAVVGRHHPMLDEVPVAFVLPVEPEEGLADRLIEACRTGLANFKVPREIRIVNDFPRVTLGKIDKNELRKTASSGSP